MPSERMSRTTPTMVASGAVGLYILSVWPSADWPGQNCFAIVSLMITTSGAFRASVAANSRPATMRIAIVAK